jgi:hypothetical protein
VRPEQRARLVSRAQRVLPVLPGLRVRRVIRAPLVRPVLRGLPVLRVPRVRPALLVLRVRPVLPVLPGLRVRRVTRVRRVQPVHKDRRAYRANKGLLVRKECQGLRDLVGAERSSPANQSSRTCR